MSAITLALDSAEASLESCGGKAINLVRLTRAGFRVPPGFVVTTAAYRAFVEANDLAGVIANATADLDPGEATSLERASEVIRAAFSRGVVPPTLAEAINAAAQPWATTPVAVRSSATAEDLADVSFAGQHDSFLDVLGGPALLAAVVDCWTSLWTARAIGYRLRNGTSTDGLALAVIVQEMVPAEVAGVLFTANPLTGARGQTVIDAVFGLGDALVSGRVEPDHVVADSATGRIVATGGGERTLTDAQVADLVEVGSRIQAEYGVPQDVEWAFAGGVLFVVQSRAITSLYPLPSAEGDQVPVWLSFGAVQGMLDPMTPLGQDAIRHILGGGATVFGSRLDLDDPMFLRAAGERLWVRIDFLLRHPIGRRLAPAVLGMLEPSVGRIVADLMLEPELRRTSRSKPTWVLGLLHFLGRVLPGIPRMLLDPVGARTRFEARAATLVAAARDREAAASAMADPAARLGARVDALRSDLTSAFPLLIPAFAPIMGPSLAMIHRLRQIAADAGEQGRGLALETLRALDGNVTTQMDLALWQVATTIRADAAARAIFTESSADEVARRYLAQDLPAAAQQALAAFLAAYGMRGVGEIDLGQARWRDNPADIVRTVQSYLAIEDPARAPDAVFRAGAAAAGEATEKLAGLVRNQRGWGGALRERQVRFLVSHLRGMSGARETPKFTLVKVMGSIRDGLLASGGDLAAAGVLERPDDIYYLHVRELARIFASPDEGWRQVVRERRERYRREQHRRQVPRIIVGDGRAIYEGLGNAADGSLSGSPVSPGIAQGRVRVVLHPQTSELAPGEILVCPGTDPAWTPLFLAAAGLITEVGGMMTHGSVVAREYGIPAIVGVHEATTRLHTGQLIRIDGASGTIEILEPGRV